MSPEDEHVHRYSGLREWFDQLVSFAEAARQELLPDSPLLAQYDYENWMGQLQAYQHVCCQRCGAFLSADALGLGAYAFEAFARICGACYDELACVQPGGLRRLARLTAYAQEQPHLFVGLLVTAQERLQLDDWKLESYLGLDAPGVIRLALTPLPGAGHSEADIAMCARIAGCDVDVLHRLLTAIHEVVETE